MSLLRSRSFLLFWIGEAASVTGAAATSVLLPLLAIETLGASAAWMGVIGAATWLPWLVVGLPAGAWVDALPPRATMIGANLLGIIAYASLLGAAALGLLTLGQIAIVAFAHGVATVFFRSAYSKLIVSLVDPDARPRANSVLFGTEHAAHLAGPGIGGLLAQWVGTVLGLVVNLAGLVVSTVCLLLVRPTHPAATHVRPPFLTAIREGLALVFGDRSLRYFAITGAVANFGLTGQSTVLTLWLARDLGLEPATIGAFFGIVALGGLVGALAAPHVGTWLGEARGMTIVLTIAGVAMPLYVLAAPGLMAWVAAVVVAFGSAGIAAGNVLRRSWVQGYVPERMLGRQSTSTQLVNFGLMPVAAVVAGGLGEVLDLRVVVLVMGLVASLANVAAWTQPWLRGRSLPAPPRRLEEVAG